MNTPFSNQPNTNTTASAIAPSTEAGAASAAQPPRTVIVVAAHPEDADLVAQNFAAQGEPIEVRWFEHARAAAAANLQAALACIVVRPPQTPPDADDDLLTLRRALPDTPILPWEHPRAA